MYIVANEGLGMSPGKLAAQAAHAAVEAYRLSCPIPVWHPDQDKLRFEGREVVQEWYKGGHYTKIVLGARDSQHLLTLERYIKERGFKTALIIDEGRTEIEPHSPTAIGVEIVDKDDEHTWATFGSIKLFGQASGPPKRVDYDAATVSRYGKFFNALKS
jgi:peptidyl-tRNA hydrolase